MLTKLLSDRFYVKLLMFCNLELATEIMPMFIVANDDSITTAQSSIVHSGP